MGGATLNAVQKMVMVLAALLSVYFVFLAPPRIIKGLNGVVVDAKAYCLGGKNSDDCAAAIINIPQLMIYLVVIFIVAFVMLLVFAEKKVNR